MKSAVYVMLARARPHNDQAVGLLPVALDQLAKFCTCKECNVVTNYKQLSMQASDNKQVKNVSRNSLVATE